MTADSKRFRVVMRGYDPWEVDRLIDEITVAVNMAEMRNMDLAQRLHEVEEAYAQALQEAEGDRAPSSPSFSDLGPRVEKILALAEEEAAAIRAAASSDYKSQQELADEAAECVRNDADMYAKERRSVAEAEAARIAEDASERLQEAEALYESQRVTAEKAIADLEATLATRFETSQQELTQQLKSSREELATVQSRLEELRRETDQIHSDAESEARRLVKDAEQRAEEIVAHGAADADRIRTESERDLAVMSEHRDSINDELTKILKQMLSTLSRPEATAPAANAQSSATHPVD